MQASIKHIIIVIGILIGLLMLAFLGLVGWYSWQLKKGSVESRLQLISQFDSDAFSSLTKQVRNTTIVNNPKQYIRPHNPRFGSPTAPITVIAFIDFECPFCRRAYAEFELIREKYSPVVQVVFKHFPISAIHPNALSAALAAQCAHEQNLFWEYYNQLFTSTILSDAAYNTYANRIQLQPDMFTRCIENSQTNALISQDIEDAIAIGVTGTPTYLVQDTLVQGVLTATNWDTLILELLNHPN
jgi:protein-disulfide isomerase